ncbi:MAG: hypothetical protein GC187_13380 [Alphaproteobacteria bacterium]|nr:hypothetical protein [Alphaproteobacteria bacterium]
MIRTLAALASLAASAAAPAGAQFPSGTPASDPGAFVLAIIDVETTGLEPGHHEMIDLGAIYTDLEGAELGRFFVRIHPDHPERAGEIARSINGYDEARWQALGAVDRAQAASAFLAFHQEMTGGRTAIFTAYNAYFDRAFLDVFLKDTGHDGFRALFTYFLLDLPSMAYGAGVEDLANASVAARLGLPAETDDPLEHTGLSGVEWNLALYRALRERVQAEGDGG